MYIFLILILEVVSIYSAPLQFHLQPLEMAEHPQSPLVLVQQQLMDQQAIQPLYLVPTVSKNHQPFIIILPDFESKNTMTRKRINDRVNTDIQNDINDNTEEDDSVTIDADEVEPIPTIEGTHKAILLLPNARFSIGSLIGAIPFLPIEINVPDTISWAYNGIANGISGIISIIGQRFPSQNAKRVSHENGLNLKTATTGFTHSILSKPLVLIAI